MTKDEINRAVAEKVMGFRQLQGWGKWWFPAKEPVTLDDAITDWNPAEDIRHAWMVVEKLLKDYIMNLANGVEGLWGCIFYTDKIFKEAQADTAPMAICLAALEAVKGQ